MKERSCYVYLYLEYGRTFYLPIRYDEETTNKIAMGGRGNVAPNLLDLVRLDKIYRVKQKNYPHAEACVFTSLKIIY